MRGGQGSPGAGSNPRRRRAAAAAIARAQARQALEARSKAYEDKLAQQQSDRQAARRARATRRVGSGSPQPSSYGQSTAIIRDGHEVAPQTRRAAARQQRRVAAYQRRHPADPVAGLSRLVGTNLLAGLTPPVGPTKHFQRRQQKQASAMNVGVAKGLYAQGKHDVQHPLSVGAILDAAMLASGGIGAAGRVTAAARLASEAERGSKAAAAFQGLSRRAQAAEVLPARLLPGGERSGLRHIKLGEHRQQVPMVSPNLATATGQHALDRIAEARPELPVIGARSRVNRLIRAERVVETKRAHAAVIPLSEAARALQGGTLAREGRRISRLPSRNVTAQEMAWQHVADYGHVGEKGVALLDRELTQLSERAAVASGRAKAILERRIKLLQAARPHVLDPSPELMHSLELSKASAEAVTESRVARRALHPTTAAESTARKIRFLHGAEYVEPTKARQGLETPRLAEARGQQARRVAARERAAEKVRKLEFTGEQRKRLGLKSEAMARREKQLGIYADDLRAQLKAIPKGTDDELHARAAAIEARFQRVVDKLGGKGKHKTVNADEQRRINQDAKRRRRRGLEPVRSLSDEMSAEAEKRVLDVIERNKHLPWAQKEQALLDEAAAIRTELTARADRKLGLGEQLHPKLPKGERLYYRGTKPGETRRISTGVPGWDDHLFVAATPEEAKLYGPQVETVAFKPDARILMYGTPEWDKIAVRQSVAGWPSKTLERAKAAGYDAVHFKDQGAFGTVVLNPGKVVRNFRAEPKPSSDLILHPHLPTTEAALKHELQRVGQEHRELAGRTLDLPVGMPSTHELRAEVRVAEKELRKLEAAWNEPARHTPEGDLIEQVAQLRRAQRGGTGAQRALLGAKGGPATEQGLAVTGIEDLQARIEALSEKLDAARGESPDELRNLREHVSKMRSELRKLEKPRAHVVPGDLPYALTATGEKVEPHSYGRATKLGAAQSVGADRLQGLEKAAEGRVTPVGLVTPPHLLPAHATRKEAEKALDAALKDAGLTRKDAGIRRVVTTKDAEPDELNGAAYAKDGMAEATHITDDPAVLMHVLERNLPIEQRAGDLGVGGLHVSDAPGIWTSRSNGKWDFVGRLTDGERNKLANELEWQVNESFKHGHIAKHEHERAVRAADDFRDGQNHAIGTLANQPYNVPASDPEFLERLGIEAGSQPTHVPVHLQGSFVQLEHSLTPEALEALKAAGFDGAFTKGGMSTTPQLVVWNNKAVKGFGDWKAPVPHEVEPGPLAFYTPDVPPRTAAQKATGGRVTSLNPKRTPTYASTGALRREGRQQVGPGVTIREQLSEVRNVERQRVGAKGVELSVPFNSAAYNETQWQVIDTLAATSAKELPFGTKAQIAAEKRAAAEVPIELDDVGSPGDLLAKVQREHQAWVSDIFPPSPGKVPAEHEHGMRMIRRSTFEALTSSQELSRSANPVVRAGLGLLDFSNKLNRAALIYLNPSYGPVQGTGNAIYLGLQQGPFAVAKIPVYAKRLTQLERADRRTIDIEVGGGAAAHLAHERGGAGPLTHLADFQNALADQQPRRIAWLHEADRMGYTTPQELHALLTEPKLKPYLNTVSERAQQAMVKFERVPSSARQAVGRAIFIAPWLEGSTRWLGRTLLDRPMTAALAEHVREKIIERQKQRLGVGKAMTGGFIPAGAAQRVGGLNLIPGVNPDAISPTGSGVGVIKAGLEATSLIGPPVHGGSRLLGMAQPTLGAVVGGLTRQDPYSGYAYPKDRSQGSIIREQLLGDTTHPAVPLLATLQTGFRGAPNLDPSKPAKLPTYYPEHGWADVGKRLAVGSLRPRRVIQQAAEAKGLAAERKGATGAKKVHLDAQKALQKGRDLRNTIDANARRYGLPGAEKGLPPDVRNAIHLRTARRVNYAHTGAETQEEMFRADNRQLLRWKKITPQVYASQMAWLATKPSKRQIEHRRDVAGRKFYGAKVLARVHRQINAAADKRHGSAAPSGVVPTDSGPVSVTQLVWH
jgi:hypothetical protein